MGIYKLADALVRRQVTKVSGGLKTRNTENSYQWIVFVLRDM